MHPAFVMVGKRGYCGDFFMTKIDVDELKKTFRNSEWKFRKINYIILMEMDLLKNNAGNGYSESDLMAYWYCTM